MLHIKVESCHFEDIKKGLKTVEGRLAKPKFLDLKPGDKMRINESLDVTIDSVHRYISFHEMIQGEGLSHLLPQKSSLRAGEQEYYRFYSIEEEKFYGVLAIRFVLC